MNVALSDEIARREQAEAERQAMQTQMLHAQKLESLGLLAGGIGHDFNNFLQGILGHTQLAEMKLSTVSEARPNLEQVRDLVGQAAGLIEQLLAYAGKTLVSKDLLNLSDLVAAMHPLTSTLADGTLDIRYSLHPALPAVEGTTAQLRQVVMNLLTNAADAVADNGGAINVRTGIIPSSREDGSASEAIDGESNLVFVEVEDAGHGMSQATLSKAFDPFFTTKSQGRGLGLAALHGIVRGHGGRLEVESEPGLGTRFRVVLPGVENTPDAREDSGSLVRTYTGRTILVVDDYEYIRLAAVEILEGLGCSLLEASNGLDSIRLFEKHHEDISVVILDLLMPEMNGSEVFQHLRRIDPEIPVLLVSAHADPVKVDEMLADGNVMFLPKPYSSSQLLECLAALDAGKLG
jgi:nitrogen-specific signal transduction histidine kinase/CheY-like chemotaxis protein